LIKSAGGQSGLSGFRFDERLGRPCYHYLGLPYYLVPTDESTTGRLYGANFGRTGLCLVHAIGTKKTFGLAVDEMVDPVSLQKRKVVHGAYALVPWEAECI
jgi:hypothetical protein